MDPTAEGNVVRRETADQAPIPGACVRIEEQLGYLHDEITKLTDDVRGALIEVDESPPVENPLGAVDSASELTMALRRYAESIDGARARLAQLRQRLEL